MSFHIALSIATYLCVSVDFLSEKTPECQGYTFEVSTVNTSGGENNGEAEIKLVGSDVKAWYHFYTMDQKLLSFELENDSIEGLKKGKYYCLVVVADECYKKLDFEIL